MRLGEATAIRSRRWRWGRREVRCCFRAWTWAVRTRREGSGSSGQSLLSVPGPPSSLRPGPEGLEGPGEAPESPEEKAKLCFSLRSLPELTWQFSTQAKEKRNRKYPAHGPASQGSGAEMFRRGEGREKRPVRLRGLTGEPFAAVVVKASEYLNISISSLQIPSLQLLNKEKEALSSLFFCFFFFFFLYFFLCSIFPVFHSLIHHLFITITCHLSTGEYNSERKIPHLKMSFS